MLTVNASQHSTQPDWLLGLQMQRRHHEVYGKKRIVKAVNGVPAHHPRRSDAIVQLISLQQRRTAAGHLTLHHQPFLVQTVFAHRQRIDAA